METIFHESDREVFAKQDWVADQAETVHSALRSADARTQAEAMAATQGLLATLQEIARKKQIVAETMNLLLRETRAARRRKVGRAVIIVALLGMLVWLMVLLRISPGGFIWPIIQVVAAIWAADRAVHARRDAATTLLKAGDPRAVGVLAVAVRDGDPHVRRVAEDALHTLLPRVRTNDAVYITPDQMQALLSLLEDYDDRLRIAVLTALEQIGDARAIPYVMQLSLFASPTVRKRAEECLPFLEERVRLARESATLLRASSAASAIAAADQLLHPAYANTPMPAEQLLRPMESQGGGNA